MWMFGTLVDLQFGDHLPSKWAFGKHPFDCGPNHLFWTVHKVVRISALLETTGVSAVVVLDLLTCLTGGHDHLGGIDHDHELAGVHMRSENRTVLAAQDSSNFGGHATQYQAIGINDIPGLCYFGLLR